MGWAFNPFTGKLDKTKNLSETVPLTDLSDVAISSAADHETLYYDSGTSEWKNNGTLKIDVDNSVIVKSGKKLIFDGA